MSSEETFKATNIDNFLDTVLETLKYNKEPTTDVKSASAHIFETISPNDENTSIRSKNSTQSNASETEHISHTRANASLYVGELDSQVTEADLFDLFNPIGPISFIRVCRDVVSKNSLGYAYVNFIEPADSERAISVLNHEPLYGRNIRIMRSQRDPGARRSTSGNLFVKNLDLAIDNRVLHETFSNFGSILSCKIAVDEKSVSKGYGFVHFEDPQAAEIAIRNVNGMVLNNKKIFVGPHIPRDLRVVEDRKDQFTCIFVKNINCNSDEQLRNMFKEYGSIVSALLNRDPEGVPRGFGFVNFKEPHAAANAVEKLNGKEINGAIIQVSRAQSRSERREELRKLREAQREAATTADGITSRYSGVNLYVKNLDFTITDDLLCETFQRFGTITSCKVMVNESGKSKGFGFVCFASPDDATKAVQEMNKFMLVSKPLYVGLAQRKEDRQSHIRRHMEAQEKVRAQRAMASAAALGENWGMVSQRGNTFVSHPIPLGGSYGGPEMHDGFVPQNSHYGNFPVNTLPSYRIVQNSVELVGPVMPGGGVGAPSLIAILSHYPLEMHTRVISDYIYGKVLKHKRVGGNQHLTSRVVGMLLSNQVEVVKIADNDHAFARVVSQVVDSL